MIKLTLSRQKRKILIGLVSSIVVLLGCLYFNGYRTTGDLAFFMDFLRPSLTGELTDVREPGKNIGIVYLQTLGNEEEYSFAKSDTIRVFRNGKACDISELTIGDKVTIIYSGFFRREELETVTPTGEIIPSAPIIDEVYKIKILHDEDC